MAENASERWTQKKDGIFSAEALNKMRSPEKLDEILPITTPITWMGLIAVLVTVFSVILWSIYGSFTVKAEGMGLIMDPQGITNVTTVFGGKIDKIYIHGGQKIKKGDKIAHIEQIQESASTRMAQYAPELATSELDAMNKVYEYDARRYQKEETEFVYSSYDGTVDELLTNEGATVGSGSPICTIRLSSGRQDLTGILYIGLDKGKRVKPGQTIQLAPNGTDVSLSGSLIGVVRSVSQYPVSTQSIQNKLGNDYLAQYILQSQQSAVMEVTFDLVKDDKSASGYLWTSQVGEHKPITAGSFCTGSIIIEKQPPIQKVFYKLSQWLRNR
mgnify:CR=1 FL=1